MGNPKSLYQITHSSPQQTTVGDLLNDKNGVAYIYHTDPDAFLAIVGKDGKTNRQRIEATYKFPEEKRYIGYKANLLPLKVGTLLYLEFSKVNEASWLTEGIEVLNNSEPAFKAAQLAAIEGDPGYFQTNKPVHGKPLTGTSQSIMPEVTVWIWCRALSPKSSEGTGQLPGQFLDLTPFVMSCTTNINKNTGGNFQITLPPLMCELDDERQWILKRNHLDRYDSVNGASIQGEGYVAQSALFHSDLQNSGEGKASDEVLVRNQFLFHNIITSNDLIFIRFETLDMEKKKRYADSRQYYVSKNNIAGNLYDMIGLVDSNAQSVTPETNDVTISISGRDGSKLLLEDGTYFYALENSQGMMKFAGQSEQKSPLIDRIYGNGALNFLSLYMHTSIDLVLKFIIQQLSNIEVIPDGLFSSFGDRINYRFNVTQPRSKSNTDYKPKVKLEPANGIWKIVKLVIDESVSGRMIQDSSFSSANGSILNFIRTACQEPLVEFYMDTYGDMYHLIVRKPPYDQNALISLIEGKINTETGTPEVPPAVINIEQEDVLDEKLMFDDSEVYSWYHFYPRNVFIGDDNSYSLSYLGAIYFEEYAKLWGSKPFQQSHPYMPYVPLNNSEKGLGLYERQAIFDLKYVVETNQYMPFTRKGKLILNGDRRIKIGNIIRYKSTGEIFFVDSVQQSYQISENSIDRITVVGVSRGMIEQLIYGVFYDTESGEKRYVSYFNIINTTLELSPRETVEKITKVRKVSDFQPLPANISETVLDQVNNKGLAKLEKYNYRPENKKVFVKFINEINRLGYNVIITSTNRSYQEQFQLNLQDSRNADPGHSRHEHGSAIDINLESKTTGKRYKKLTSKEAWEATGVPALAKQMGLQWASGNGSFGNYVDRVHFQIVNSSSEANDEVLADRYEEYTEEVRTIEINRDKIFSNFKVNKFSFNFFLKKLQFDPSYKRVTSRNVFQNDQQGTPIAPIIKSVRKN
ncbi:MAG: M15 family metallopeptidase [Chitinophagaceae bacterium]|nr:M15 family metallopeptidase [Chitinophagaceae bacterium]